MGEYIASVRRMSARLRRCDSCSRRPRKLAGSDRPDFQVVRNEKITHQFGIRPAIVWVKRGRIGRAA